MRNITKETTAAIRHILELEDAQEHIDAVSAILTSILMDYKDAAVRYNTIVSLLRGQKVDVKLELARSITSDNSDGSLN